MGDDKEKEHMMEGEFIDEIFGHNVMFECDYIGGGLALSGLYR
jgi:hypothetical protein